MFLVSDGVDTCVCDSVHEDPMPESGDIKWRLAEVIFVSKGVNDDTFECVNDAP